jgi:hypothetical protein
MHIAKKKKRKTRCANKMPKDIKDAHSQEKEKKDPLR